MFNAILVVIENTLRNQTFWMTCLVWENWVLSPQCETPKKNLVLLKRVSSQIEISNWVGGSTGHQVNLWTIHECLRDKHNCMGRNLRSIGQTVILWVDHSVKLMLIFWFDTEFQWKYCEEEVDVMKFRFRTGELALINPWIFPPFGLIVLNSCSQEIFPWLKESAEVGPKMLNFLSNIEVIFEV